MLGHVTVVARLSSPPGVRATRRAAASCGSWRYPSLTGTTTATVHRLATSPSRLVRDITGIQVRGDVAAVGVAAGDSHVGKSRETVLRLSTG